MHFAVLATVALQLITAPPKPGHATITPSPGEVTGTAGARLSLTLDVQPKPGIHVYAPGAGEFYIPISVKLNPQPQLKPGKVAYPKSETMIFADEKVSVFEKPFRLTQDVTLDESLKPGATVVVTGTVHYQACDDKVCFPPESAPVSWTVLVK
jgi:DsbC/DsbD-like thiol-disulfide interchange protein